MIMELIIIYHCLKCFRCYIDIESPVITSNTAQVAVFTDPGQTTAPAMWTEPTATDNSGIYTMTSSHNSGSHFDIGITIVTYTAVDRAGNVATYSFHISVQGK